MSSFSLRPFPLPFFRVITIAICFLAMGCASTRQHLPLVPSSEFLYHLHLDDKIDDNTLESNKASYSDKVFARSENFTQVKTFEHTNQTKDAYIFIRLYNPHYSSPLYYANILKTGIKLTEVNGFFASHASIAFYLDDFFYGITLMSTPHLWIEQCTNPEMNNFMKHCDAEKSTQITFALKVSEKEWNVAKNIVKDLHLSSYDTNQNFRIARKVQWRKFFTKKENQSLLPFYSSKKNIPLINEKIKKSKKKRFVCSNFIAYILYNSVENVKNFFDKNGIDFRYLTVTDIASIPGMTALFSSSWESFRECASIFLQENPIFARPY